MERRLRLPRMPPSRRGDEHARRSAIVRQPRRSVVSGKNSTKSLGRVSAPAVRPRIQAVTFDVGGTLIEVWPSVGQVYAEVAARNGVKGLSAAIVESEVCRRLAGGKTIQSLPL